MSISLVMVVRDEWPWVAQAVEEILPYVASFIFLDAGSIDGTYEGLSKLGRGVQIHTDFMKTNFGQLKTAVSWMADAEYILLLDGDERLTNPDKLPEVVEWTAANSIPAVGIPRRRWADLQQTQQIELQAYPDWQTRLYRNNPTIRWVGALHEKLSVPAHNLEAPLILEHHVDSLHLSDSVRKFNRSIQRKVLAAEAGVRQEGTDEALKLAGG